MQSFISFFLQPTVAQSCETTSIGSGAVFDETSTVSVSSGGLRSENARENYEIKYMHADWSPLV